MPGVNLRSVGTIRDAQKWPKRDGRTDTNKLDFINYNLLSPYTVQKTVSYTHLVEAEQAVNFVMEIPLNMGVGDHTVGLYKPDSNGDPTLVRYLSFSVGPATGIEDVYKRQIYRCRR